ncbi:MAG: hypothetical protein FGM62_05880 [Methylobacterium sp.]|nr:hypothetical protein [Methylobacterium sp.]
MLILRFLLVLGLISVVASLGIFLMTRDRRYLRFSWQLFKLFLVLLLVLGGVLFLGRLIV